MKRSFAFAIRLSAIVAFSAFPCAENRSSADELPLAYLRGSECRTAISSIVGNRQITEIVAMNGKEECRLGLEPAVGTSSARNRVHLKNYPLRNRIAGDMYWEIRSTALQDTGIGYSITDTPLFQVNRIPLSAIRDKSIDYDVLKKMSLSERPVTEKPLGRFEAAEGRRFSVDHQVHIMQQIYDSALIDERFDPETQDGRGKPVRIVSLKGKSREAPKSCAYDIVPIDPLSLYLVVATTPRDDGSRLLMTKIDAKAVGILRLRLEPPLKENDGRSIKWHGIWELVEEWESDFVAPFRAIRVRDEWWFVTTAGTLHRVMRDSSGVKKVKEVRVRDGELIQVLFLDEDREMQPFAFTSKYWFEVKDPIEYHEFTLPKFKSDDVIPMLEQCAREIRNLYPAK